MPGQATYQSLWLVDRQDQVEKQEARRRFNENERRLGWTDSQTEPAGGTSSIRTPINRETRLLFRRSASDMAKTLEAAGGIKPPYGALQALTLIV